MQSETNVSQVLRGTKDCPPNYDEISTRTRSTDKVGYEAVSPETLQEK
jgi:hypothetical protein